MTADIDLLPLPEWMSRYTIPTDDFEYGEGVMLDDCMRNYARANVDHATALLQAEVEARRAELDVWEGLHASEVQVRQRWQARAERLEEEVETLRAEVERWKRINAEQVKLHVKAEIRAERLAEALETCLEMEERPKVIELAKAALAALEQEDV